MAAVQEQPTTQESEAFTVLHKKDGTASCAGASDGKPGETVESTSSCASTSPTSFLEEYCPPQLKTWYKENAEEMVSLASLKFCSVQKSFVTPNARELHMAHALCMVIWGGSHYTLACLMGFYSLFDVYKTFQECKALASPKSSAPLYPSDLQKCLATLAKLAVCFCAVWSSGFVSAVTIAFCLETYITEALLASPVKEMMIAQFKISTDMKQWVPFMTTCAVRFVLAFMALGLPRMQACLFFCAYGGNKFFESLSEETRKRMSQPAVMGLDTKTVGIWGVCVVSTLWQLMYGYESSVLNLLVPLGFLLPARNKKVLAAGSKMS